MKLWIRRLHRWIGLISCAFMLLVASTALALNHRELWQPLVMQAHKTETGFGLSQARVWTADPHRTGHLLAADGHRLWQSTDGGTSWSELKLYVPAEDVSAIAFDPAKAGRIWVGLRRAGLYASEDGGEIWEEVVDLPFDPVAGETLEALQPSHDGLYLKSSLAHYRPAGSGWQAIGSQAAGAKRESLSLQDWLWRLHTGRGFGPLGLLLYDLISLALILLSISGLLLFRRPKRAKRAGKRASDKEAELATALESSES